MRKAFWISFLCALLIILLSYIFLDRSVAIAARNFPAWAMRVFEILQLFCDTLANLTFWPAAFFFIYAYTQKTAIAKRLLIVGVSIAVTNLFTLIIKTLLARARPELFFTDNLYGFFFFSGNFFFESFPSGHAATIGAVAGSLACFFPRCNVLFYLGAFILAFSRVAVEAHFLSDIFAGLFLGIVIGHWVYVKLDLSKHVLAKRS